MKSKTIGLIGGITWESSVIYYKILNQKVNSILGGVHSCPLLMHSFDFGIIAELQIQGRWKELGEMIATAALGLERSGADLIVICSNTMHKVANEVEARLTVPLVHIADAIGVEIKRSEMKRVGLIGTTFTMEEEFLKGRLKQEYGIDTIVPDAASRAIVHEIIYSQLAKGIFSDASRKKILAIIGTLVEEGAQGLILGCTELPLLINDTHTDIVLFDTTSIHAIKAVEFAVNNPAVILE